MTNSKPTQKTTSQPTSSNNQANHVDNGDTTLGVVAIPYEGGNIALMPDVLLVAILPVANHMLPAYNEHPTVVGAFIYEDVMVPVVDLAKFANESDNTEKKQLIVVNSINEKSAVEYFAFIANAPVNRMMLKKGMLKDLRDEPIKGCHSEVEINYRGNKRNAYVIDLYLVEEMLFPLR